MARRGVRSPWGALASAPCGRRTRPSPPSWPPSGRPGRSGPPRAATRAAAERARAAVAVVVEAAAAVAVAAVVDTDERPPRGAGNGGTPRGGNHRGPLHGGGMGIGWRPAIAGTVADLPGLRVCGGIAGALGGGGRGPRALPPGGAGVPGRGGAG